MKFKGWLQSLLNTLLKNSDLHKKLDALESKVNTSIDNNTFSRNYVDRGTQQLLAFKYRELVARNEFLKFEDVEFRNYSQTGEDGIIWYIFSLIGATNKRAIELCAGNGIECNSANLIINHGWDAMLVDGNKNKIEQARRFYRNNPGTSLFNPIIVHRWICAENINDVIWNHGFDGEADLLTIDIDGVDYWLWKAINVVSPRVVIVEFCPFWFADRSVTVPYQKTFIAKWFKIDEQAKVVEKPRCLSDRYTFFNGWGVYGGASLSAFVKLGKEKGYRLVGTNKFRFNAFFVRNDVAENILPEVSAESCFAEAKLVQHLRYAREFIKDFEWQEV